MPPLHTFSGTKNENTTEMESTKENYDLEEELTQSVINEPSSLEALENEILELDKMGIVDEEEGFCL